MVVLEVNAWLVGKAVDEVLDWKIELKVGVLDWKIEGRTLKVVLFMLLAVAVKRQTMVRRSMVMSGY